MEQRGGLPGIGQEGRHRWCVHWEGVLALGSGLFSVSRLRGEAGERPQTGEEARPESGRTQWPLDNSGSQLLGRLMSTFQSASRRRAGSET